MHDMHDKHKYNLNKHSLLDKDSFRLSGRNINIQTFKIQAY